MSNIVELLVQKKLTLSAAESFTGGGFSNFITNIPNSSYTFKGGLVSYSIAIKENVLKVDHALIEKYGAVSKQCAEAMAINCLKLFDTDIAVSFTGNAGPSASEGKAVGLVFLGYATKQACEIIELHLTGSREEIKKQAIDYMVNKIINNII